jgi:O-antigen/teichoic acid export membrane protein
LWPTNAGPKTLVLRLWSSSFVRNVSILVGGSAIAQGVSFVILPLLSRLYQPTDFGDYALFLSVGGILGSVAHLCYDQAIVLPHAEKDAALLVLLGGVIAFCLATAVCIVVGGVSFFFTQAVSVRSIRLTSWVGLLSLSLFLSALSQLLLAWTIRKKCFHATAVSNVGRALVLVGAQSVLGIFRPDAIGLILGGILAEVSSIAILLLILHRNNSMPQFANVRLNEVRTLAYEFRDFPKYSAPQSILNACSQSAPALILMYFYGATVVGYYSMSYRLVQSPMNLLLAPIRQVFLQKTSEQRHRGEALFPQFRKITFALGFGITIPSIVFFMFAPSLFQLYLGSVWSEAGIYARWLILWLGCQFVNVPAIVAAQVLRKQKQLLVYDSLLFVSRGLALILGGIYLASVQTIISFSLVGFVFNGAIIVWMWSITKKAELV